MGANWSPIQLSAQALQRYVGDYELGGEIYTISARNGRLFVSAHDHPEFQEQEVLAVSESELVLSGSNAELTATQDSHGRFNGFTLNQDDASRSVRKIR